MNKKGNAFLWIILFVMLLLVGGGVYLAFSTSSQKAIETDVTQVTSCPDSTGILTVNAYNALQEGSNVTPTLKVGVNGGPVSTTATSGTTTFAVGDKLVLHGTLANYLDEGATTTMKCGGITVGLPLYYSTSDNPAIRTKNDDGDYTNYPATNTTNQTNIAAGETLVMEVEFTGTALESSGEGVYVIEFPASTTANITKVELGSLSTTSVPSVYSAARAGSKIVAFTVPAIDGGDRKTYPLTVTLAASKDLAGRIDMTWYAKQKFIDDDGSIGYGIEDSDGTAKYENTVTAATYINAA